MKSMPLITSLLCAFVLIGCGTKAAVSPSQNNALLAISPSTIAVSQGGAMQHSLDQWLKEEWIPLSTNSSVDANMTSLKQENLNESDSDESWSLQRYVEKWNIYHKNKATTSPSVAKEVIQLTN